MHGRGVRRGIDFAVLNTGSTSRRCKVRRPHPISGKVTLGERSTSGISA